MVVQLKEGISQNKEGGQTVESIRTVESVRVERRIVEDIVSHIGHAMEEHVQASGLILPYVRQVDESSVGTKMLRAEPSKPRNRFVAHPTT